jgi:hypothetical protein
MNKAAFISDDGRYRYWLSRDWDATKKRVMFVMLNPSTADASVDDPTIRKCVGFAQRLGYGGLSVYNLFAYRATDPKDLESAGYPVGPDNDEHIAAGLGMVDAVIFAWGANAREAIDRIQQVAKLVYSTQLPVCALRLLADGVPQHPLMLPYSCQLIPLSGRLL